MRAWIHTTALPQKACSRAPSSTDRPPTSGLVVDVLKIAQYLLLRHHLYAEVSLFSVLLGAAACRYDASVKHICLMSSGLSGRSAHGALFRCDEATILSTTSSAASARGRPSASVCAISVGFLTT